jgi:outer membrane autotransporter protein
MEGYPYKGNCDPLCDSGWTTWAQGMGTEANIGTDGNASGLHYTTAGLAVGLDRRFGSDTQIGVVGGYSSTYATLDDRNDNGSIDGGQLAVYLNQDFEVFYFTGIAAGGYNGYTTTRSIEFGGVDRIDRIAHVNTAGKDYSFYAEIGRTLSGHMFHLQPYIAMEYIEAYQDAFTEQGAGSIDITSGGAAAQACRGLVGARVAGTFHTISDQECMIEARAAWRHEYLNDSRVLDATFADVSSTSFAISGVNVDRDVGIFGLGVNYRFAKTFSVYCNFDLLAAQDDRADAITGGFQYLW